MTIAIVTSASAGFGATPVTTASFNSTGADLMLCFDFGDPGSSFSDNKSNGAPDGSLTVQSQSSGRVQMHYYDHPAVGTGHTVSLDGGGAAGPLVACVISGSATSPLDQQNGAASYATVNQPGSITPTQDNEIVVAACCVGGNVGGFTVNESFTELVDAYDSIQDVSYCIAYKIQTTATAQNPTFTWSGNTGNRALTIGSFKAAAGGGGASPFPQVITSFKKIGGIFRPPPLRELLGIPEYRPRNKLQFAGALAP